MKDIQCNGRQTNSLIRQHRNRRAGGRGPMVHPPLHRRNAGAGQEGVSDLCGHSTSCHNTLERQPGMFKTKNAGTLQPVISLMRINPIGVLSYVRIST